MMRARLDLLGMFKYHPTLFDSFVIPEGLDKEVLTDNLLMESAELEVLYPDADFMESAIGRWSQKMLHVWTELYATTQYDYNPIWNKDGMIYETVTRDLATTEDVTTNVDREDKLTDKNTRNFEDKDTRNLAGSVDNGVYGYNSSTLAPESKVSTSDTGTDTINHTGTDTVDHTGTQDIDTTVDRDTTDTGTITTTRAEQGNIGITSTQELIEAQRSVVQLNLYDVIIKDFIKRFCLLVY